MSDPLGLVAIIPDAMACIEGIDHDAEKVPEIPGLRIKGRRGG
jgi:hypothetical protein